MASKSAGRVGKSRARVLIFRPRLRWPARHGVLELQIEKTRPRALTLLCARAKRNAAEPGAAGKSAAMRERAERVKVRGNFERVESEGIKRRSDLRADVAGAANVPKRTSVGTASRSSSQPCFYQSTKVKGRSAMSRSLSEFRPLPTLLGLLICTYARFSRQYFCDWLPMAEPN